MLFTEQDLSMTNAMDILNEATYLSEDESMINPQTIPVKEVSRLGYGVVRFDDVDKLSEDYGCDYIDAMYMIAESSDMNPEYLAVSVPEEEIIADPEIVNELANIVIQPLSEYDPEYQFVTECVEAYAESGNEDYLGMLLEVYYLDEDAHPRKKAFRQAAAMSVSKGIDPESRINQNEPFAYNGEFLSGDYNALPSIRGTNGNLPTTPKPLTRKQKKKLARSKVKSSKSPAPYTLPKTLTRKTSVYGMQINNNHPFGELPLTGDSGYIPTGAPGRIMDVIDNDGKAVRPKISLIRQHPKKKRTNTPLEDKKGQPAETPPPTPSSGYEDLTPEEVEKLYGSKKPAPSPAGGGGNGTPPPPPKSNTPLEDNKGKPAETSPKQEPPPTPPKQPVANNQSRLSRATNWVKNNKVKTAVGVGLGAAAIGGGIYAYKQYKNRPRSVIAKRIAALRGIYKKFMINAQRNPQKANIFKRMAAKILSVIDKLLGYLQNKADGR